MQCNLSPHPAAPPGNPPFKLWANVELAAAFGADATVNIWFGIGAPAARFVIPETAESRRADGLWESSCFEAFLREGDAAAYREWNFAPSGDWAAYDFAGYREGREEAEVAAAPYVRMEDNFTWWTLGATFTVPADRQWQLGLSAVLEETDGTKSYWALAHPQADKPDFHDSVCFAARLA